MTGSILVFGASGAIGAAICSHLRGLGAEVVGVGRRPRPETAAASSWLVWNVGKGNATEQGPGAFASLAAASVCAVVWAQGMNVNDSIHSFDAARHDAMYKANVSYILESLHDLLGAKALARGARLCVVSSIWQNIARPNKLSYCVTKAALQGLVQSLAIDLGQQGMLVNAVLPGALDTPMTRANLTAEQIGRLEEMTPLGALPQLEDVCHVVEFLISARNTGLTGQFIAADKGFSHAKFI